MGQALSVQRPFVRAAIWLLLAVPAALFIAALLRGELAMDLLHPTGETSLRLMILAMLPGPLIAFFGPNRFLRGWVGLRRNLGVAAFGYAVLHLALYVIDIGGLAAIIDEFALPAIWTGWLGFALMLGAASISSDAAMARLGARRWKQIQRAVYAALGLSLAHWFLLDNAWGPPLIHLSPLILAWSLRLVAHVRRSTRKDMI